MSEFIVVIEYLGIIAFAISGALKGIKHRNDLLGVVVLGITTAVGGGIIRDMILGVTPPFSLRSGINIYLAIIVSLLVFFVNLFDENVNRWTINKLFDTPLIVSDAIGLGVFTITGMQVAYNIYDDYSMILYIFVGVITGVGGGIIRDVLTNEVPYILERHVYASAAILGAVSYHLLVHYNLLPKRVSMLICIGLIFIVRILAYKNEWNLPKATRIIK